MRSRKSLSLVAGLAAVVMVTGVALAQPDPEAAKLVNPVAVTPESLAAGEKTYQRYCRGCHGKLGGGGLGPSLIDATWDHGGTDGEIFTAIQKGLGPRMEAWDDRIDATETWNLVNYIRSLAATPQ